MGEFARSPSRKGRSAWEDAAAFGCDMQQIAHNLTLTVRERLLRHDRALAAALALRKAAEARRGRP